MVPLSVSSMMYPQRANHVLRGVATTKTSTSRPGPAGGDYYHHPHNFNNFKREAQSCDDLASVISKNGNNSDMNSAAFYAKISLDRLRENISSLKRGDSNSGHQVSPYAQNTLNKSEMLLNSHFNFQYDSGCGGGGHFESLPVHKSKSFHHNRVVQPVPMRSPSTQLTNSCYGVPQQPILRLTSSGQKPNHYNIYPKIPISNNDQSRSLDLSNELITRFDQEQQKEMHE